MPNQWSLARTVDPTQEPITPADMRTQSRIPLNAEDNFLMDAITDARVYAENFMMSQILTATYRLSIDYFPSWTVKLPMPPCQSVTSITFLDTQGVVQTIDPSLYVVDLDSRPARITPAYNCIWPITRIQMAAVKIMYVAGYTSPALVPGTTKRAIKLLAAHYYTHRDDTEEVKLLTIPNGAQTLLESERVMDFSGPLGSSSNVPGVVSAWGRAGWWN